MECQTLVFEAPASKRHKLKPGENLSRIASKHGLKNWKGIWDAKGNSKLKSKRKKPELLQPGDILVIPPSPEMLKRAQSNHAKALKAHVARIDERIATARRAMDMLTKYRQSVAKDLDEIPKLLKKMYQEADAWATGVDVAAGVITPLVGAARLAKVAHRAAREAGEELAKLNKAQLRDAFKDLGKKKADAIGRILSEGAKGTESEALAAGKIAIDSFFKMTSPSFWGWTIASIIEGRSWSEAVTTSPKTEYEKNRKRLQALHRDTISHISRKIGEQQDILRALKECKEQAIAGAPARF